MEKAYRVDVFHAEKAIPKLFCWLKCHFHTEIEDISLGISEVFHQDALNFLQKIPTESWRLWHQRSQTANNTLRHEYWLTFQHQEDAHSFKDIMQQKDIWRGGFLGVVW